MLKPSDTTELIAVLITSPRQCQSPRRSSLQLYETPDPDVLLLQSLPAMGAKTFSELLRWVHCYNVTLIFKHFHSKTLLRFDIVKYGHFKDLCHMCSFKSIELTRSATLHRPSESWSKDSTVSTPGEQEQAFSSRRSEFLRASFVATSKPAGQLSSGTPNKPW